MKRKNIDLIRELRERRERCAIHNMTFAPIPEGFKRELEKYQEARFQNWWATWIEPIIAEIEARLVKPKKP